MEPQGVLGLGILNKIFKKSGKYYLALDVGTEFVKALIFKIENVPGEGTKGVVYGVGRQRQRLSDMQSGAVTNISGVVESCSYAIERAEQAAKARADEVIIGIAGELVKGAATTVNYERLKPKTKIDLEELKTIVNKVQRKAFDRVREQLSWETGYSEVEVRLVNAVIVDVRIDGYRVTNPLGFQGKDVSVTIFNAFAPLIHLGALQSIAGDLDLDLISITAEPYAVSRCVGVEESQEFSGIFIDIGGGTTDIAVVRNGGVEGTKMFAIGGRSFTKRLASVLNVPFSRAEEVKIAYSGKHLKKESEKLVRDALLSDCQVWLAGVELSLSEFSEVDLLPSRIFLCGGGSALPEIKEVLEKDDWAEKLPFAKKPKVSFIDPKDIHRIIDKTGELTDPKDVTPMSLANLVIDLGEEEEILPKLLKKVIRMAEV